MRGGRADLLPGQVEVIGAAVPGIGDVQVVVVEILGAERAHEPYLVCLLIPQATPQFRLVRGGHGQQQIRIPELIVGDAVGLVVGQLEVVTGQYGRSAGVHGIAVFLIADSGGHHPHLILQSGGGQLRRGEDAHWTAWDWLTNEPGTPRLTRAAEIVLVEGVGACNELARPLLDTSVWIELPAASRKLRAMERDGRSYEKFWDAWAEQEESYLAADPVWENADVLHPGPAPPSSPSWEPGCAGRRGWPPGSFPPSPPRT